MEPNYVGVNGRIDAMAVAWLFANDYVFFNPDEITWDGHNHGVAGIQINAANMDEIPVFVDNAQQLVSGVVDLLLTLESNEALRVPRSKIHPALHDALREGDLTGLTLFNLQACASALQFAPSNSANAQSVLKMCGLEKVLESPAAAGETFAVLVDSRLTSGIPGFYELVKQMFISMRAYNGIDLPFILVFTNSRNFDADQCFGEVDYMVEGAVSEAFHVEVYGEDWKPSDAAEAPALDGKEALDEEELSGALDDEDDGEEADPRQATLALLRLLVLTSQLAGTASFPQELLDELERAENGDESVDLDELARKLNEVTLDAKPADFSNLTFEGGAIAKGRRFNIKAPCGWTVVQDYAEQTFLGEQVRPFVIVQGEVEPGENLEMRDRIIYSSLAGDMEVSEEKAAMGTDDFNWALRFYNAHNRSGDGFAAMKPVAVWDCEVLAVNTKCLVVQNQVTSDGANALEFYIHPYANDHADFVRVVLSYEEGVTDLDRIREVMKEMAATVELDSLVVPTCVKNLERALAVRVSKDDFTQMVMDFAKPYAAFRQLLFDSGRSKYEVNAENPNEKDALLAGAQVIADFCNRAIPYFEQILKAYEKQESMGASASDLGEMIEAIDGFNDLVFPKPDIFERGDAQIVERAGIFKPTGKLNVARTKLISIKNGIEAELAAEKKRKAEEARKAEAAAKLAKLQAREKQLSGRSAEIYQIIKEWGGSVDLGTMCRGVGLGWGDVESMYSNVGFLGELVKERVEEHPVEGAGSRCKRFYTWRQVDDAGNPKFDAAAYVNRLKKEIDYVEASEERSELSRCRMAFVDKLNACGMFDFSTKKELKAAIAVVDGQLAALSGRYSLYGDLADLKNRLSKAKVIASR